MDAICSAVVQKGCRLWIDAEQQVFQDSIDDLALRLMYKYNSSEKSYIYNTYQAYLKSTPERLSRHLRLAAREHWCFGLKLVRGAYIASEPERHQVIHSTKEGTDDCYDGIVESLLEGRYPVTLKGEEECPLPRLQLFLATHNQSSIERARAHQWSRLTGHGHAQALMIEYGQLQGMADEISCQLLQSDQQTLQNSRTVAGEAAATERMRLENWVPSVYKCLCWGSLIECTHFLVRRAVENQGALDRTRLAVVALRREIWRRAKGSFART